MKKTWLVLLLAMLMTLTACGGNKKEEAKAEGEKNAIETLKIQFVPSREPEEIVTQTEPLKEILKAKLAEKGYDVKNIDITVGTNYEATGEALSAGSVDVGFIPGGTYAIYDDGAEVILTATRKGLSVESDNAKDWNDKKPTEQIDDQVNFYRALIIAGPSEKGKELAAKVNKGEKLTWEDLSSAKWSVMSSSSPAGYIYPYLWLQKNYEKGITDLSSLVQADSYPSSMARLASGQVDVMVGFADVRMDNADKWQSEFGKTQSIWDETNVIGVTDKIFNDTISVSKNSEIMTDDFKKALSDSFMEIAQTDEGKKIISIYSHEGYQVAKDSDYDGEREAQKLLKELKN